MKDESLGNRIKNLRKAKSLSQEKLADKAELSQQHISRIEKGITYPGVATLTKISNVLNIPLDDLRDRLGELDKTKPVYVMCQSGLRSYLATRILNQNGFDSYNFTGGYRLYSSIHYDRLASSNSFACGMEK